MKRLTNAYSSDLGERWKITCQLPDRGSVEFEDVVKSMARDDGCLVKSVRRSCFSPQNQPPPIMMAARAPNIEPTTPEIREKTNEDWTESFACMSAARYSVNNNLENGIE